eukprot:GHVR01032482.1.p1 GENE.GHVR01032482.1~~GHVR01032482.1.p1  ORF type:complete len:140 (+),score=12.12 GHVR01032482.1:423-842(+)
MSKRALLSEEVYQGNGIKQLIQLIKPGATIFCECEGPHGAPSGRKCIYYLKGFWCFACDYLYNFGENLNNRGYRGGYRGGRNWKNQENNDNTAPSNQYNKVRYRNTHTVCSATIVTPPPLNTLLSREAQYWDRLHPSRG